MTGNELISVALLLPVGLLMLLLIQILGQVFSFNWAEKEKENQISELIFGTLALLSIFSVIFFKGKTIFSLFFIWLLVDLIHNKEKITISISIKKSAIPFGFFSFLFLFRFISIYDFATEDWSSLFKDDYFYMMNSSAIFYTKNENLIYNIILKELKFNSTYANYHYFSLYPSILIKYFTGINFYFLFNFVTVPLLQLLGLMGLFSIGKSLQASDLKSGTASLLAFSSLRYNFWDNSIFNWLGLSKLNEQVVFSDYFGIQYLNSGFGIKFSLALGLLSMIYVNRTNFLVLSKNLWILCINPLFLFISLLANIFLWIRFYRDWKNIILKYLLVIIPFMFFNFFFKTKNGSFEINELVSNFQKIININPKSTFLSLFFESVNQNYNLLLLPLLLWIKKNKLNKKSLFSSLVLFNPILTSYFSASWLYYIYYFSILILLILILRENFLSNDIWKLFSFLIFSSLFSAFSQVYPEINQIFMFINFTIPAILGLYLLISYLPSNFFWISILIIYSFYYILLNYQENKYRSIPLILTEDIKNLVDKKEKEKSSDLVIYGIFNSKSTYQFFNQFYSGEEVFWASDRFIPTPVILPTFSKLNRKNSDFLKWNFPVFHFFQKEKRNFTAGEFAEAQKISLVVVPKADSSLFNSENFLYRRVISLGKNREELLFFK